MSEKRKVLIIGFFFPYREGSLRMINLVKGLSTIGWEPIVLTAPLHHNLDMDVRVLEVDFKEVLEFWKKLFGFNPGFDIRHQVNNRRISSSKKALIKKLFNIAAQIFHYPHGSKHWVRNATLAGGKILAEEQVSAIISVSPVTSHLIAKNLKDSYDLQWIADYPDLWSQNHNYSYGGMRRYFDRRLEVKTLRNADVITCTSNLWANELRKIHDGKEVVDIPHGFDLDQWKINNIFNSDKLTLVYTGTIYRGKQNTSKLFRALSELFEEKKLVSSKIDVKFYGTKLDWLEEEINGFKLSSTTSQYGIIPRDRAYEAQRNSHVLLMFNWEGTSEPGVRRGWFARKLFDYLAARRPILLIGGAGDDTAFNFAKQTKVGTYCMKVDDVKLAILKYYEEFILNGSVRFNGVESEILKYSDIEVTRKYVELIENKKKVLSQ